VDYDDLEALRRGAPAWRLLCAEHAPLLLTFLGSVFVDENAKRLEELHRQRAEIDREIAKGEQGQQGELTFLDPAGIRDRYQQFAATARELLGDFREVAEGRPTGIQTRSEGPRPSWSGLQASKSGFVPAAVLTARRPWWLPPAR
jgi:hypothetical protein